MAEALENEDLDLGEGKSSKKKLLIIIAVAVLLLIGGGVAAYVLWGSGDAAMEEAEEAEAAEARKVPAHYQKLDPVFVVNLPGRPSLLQVGVSVRVSSQEMIEFIKHNDPMIRHHVLNLLQSREGADLTDRAAKEALQREMLEEINRIAKELSGPGEVDALYFTSFVMQ